MASRSRVQAQHLPSGFRPFWGVPFDLGPREGASWITLDAAGSSTRVELRQSSTFLVFAHLCDVSHDPSRQAQPADYRPGEVTRPGEHLADYALLYADGTQHCQPIRRRFEVGEAMAVGGLRQRAFAARPHVEDGPCDWRGPYAATMWANRWGAHQTGVKTGVSRIYAPGMLLYWIYALENPHREKDIVALRLSPTGAGRLAIAGITLYKGEEHPLRYRALESLRVTLRHALPLDDLQAQVDLGIIARQ